MLEVLGRDVRLGGVSRRSFLRIGSLGLAGLSLPELLASESRKDTAIILFWMAGGPSHIDTYDMKPAAPAEVRGPFKPISTRLPGFQVCELLPRHAQLADRFSIVRSIRHTLGVHDDASHWVQTGYPLLQARERGQQNPAQGAAISKIRGPNQPGLPANVSIPEAYHSRQGFYQSAAFLGRGHDPVNAGIDPKLGNYRKPEFALPADLSLDRLSDRRELTTAFDNLSRQAEQRSLDDANARAFELVAGSKAREAFELGREPDRLHDRYGRHAWGQAALLARRLVEAGTTFVTINLYEKDIDWWDDHYTLEKNLRKRLPPFDQSLCALIEDLAQRGMAERVLVAAFGEFGRGPRIDANAGRGHWPHAMSALLSGGGIRAGQIVGATSADGGSVRDRPLGPGDLLSTMYRVMGIDSALMLPDAQNRPVRLVDEGTPIRELIG
ncbi:MAG: DUF1501 domain-containing protein [Gemmataceae bacterium]|nr:DUF1501 domain-containing protein [Gemmataceae bacterium]